MNEFDFFNVDVLNLELKLKSNLRMYSDQLCYVALACFDMLFFVRL